MRGFSMLFQRNWGKIRRIGRPAACNRDAVGNLSRNVAEKMGLFGITCSDGTMTESETRTAPADGAEGDAGALVFRRRSGSVAEL